jgi:hypothetical protein
MMAAEQFTGQPGSTVPLKETVEAFDKLGKGTRPPARARRSSSSVASTTWPRRPRASARRSRSRAQGERTWPAGRRHRRRRAQIWSGKATFLFTRTLG